VRTRVGCHGPAREAAERAASRPTTRGGAAGGARQRLLAQPLSPAVEFVGLHECTVEQRNHGLLAVGKAGRTSRRMRFDLSAAVDSSPRGLQRPKCCRRSRSWVDESMSRPGGPTSTAKPDPRAVARRWPVARPVPTKGIRVVTSSRRGRLHRQRAGVLASRAPFAYCARSRKRLPAFVRNSVTALSPRAVTSLCLV
jgi:hypothetical protein